MARPIQITIPKPCHENWDAMQPADKGRHCLSCQKTVIDFTNMTDGDILKHFKKAAAHRPGAELCGRFMSDQLNRQLIPPPPLRAGFHWRGWQWIIAGALLTADASAPSRRPPLQEQRLPAVKTDTTGEIIVGALSFPGKPDIDTILVSDTVEMGTPSVLMGDIAVLPPDSIAKPPDSLMRPTCVHPADSTADSLDQVFTGGIEVQPADSTESSSDSTEFASNPTLETLSPTKTTIAGTAGENALRMYPNPIPRGSTYHLQFPAGGDYQLALFNTSGALVQQRALSVSAPNQIIEGQLPTGLTPGVYILRATRHDRPQPYTTKLLIQ